MHPHAVLSGPCNYYVVYYIHYLWFSHTVLWSDSLQHQPYGVYRIGFMQIHCSVIDNITKFEVCEVLCICILGISLTWL